MKRISLILAISIIGALVYWSQTHRSSTTLPSTDHVSAQTSTDSATTSAQDSASSDTSPAASSEITPQEESSPIAALDTSALDAARTKSLLSRTPKGIWASRVPVLDDYASSIPAAHATAIAEFRSRFPDLDPTEVQHFAQATLLQRDTYGDTLDESEAALFTNWLQPMELMQRAAVDARANLVGVVLNGSEPIDLEGSTRAYSLVGFHHVSPSYTYTQNAAAAESTAANLIRLIPTYDTQLTSPVDGTGLYVNVNDHGTIYDENPEFQLPNAGGTRIVYKEIYDGGDRTHMTHCAGTVGAWGYNASIMGMAPRVWIRSHIQQYTSDIINHGMIWPGQKHNQINPRTNETEMKSVMGTTSLGLPETGSYDWTAANFDSTLRDYPYYIHFYAAANAGPNYNTIAVGQQMSKNVITIGAVGDTVRDNSGAYVSGGSIAGFSSRGPSLDGRIKPDLTANGTGLQSPNSATGSGNGIGTSMACPNASGSTTLLIDYINRKFPGHFFRSSTLKALLINTATDRGDVGPDYNYGYGIINVKAAADIIKRYAANPSSRVILEDTLSTGQTWSQSYNYDGDGPIRLSLTWIDPSGVASYSTTDRSPRLINNLNVRLIGPGGTTHQPYVMPFTTGNGTYAAYDTNLYSAPAVTGNNFTDNMEQVFVSNPPAGTYTIQVTHSGSLQNGNAQPFSLAISNLSGSTPITPVLTSLSPTIGNASNNFILTLDGSGFLLGSDVFLRRSATNGTTEQAQGYGIIPVGNRIIARFDTATLAKGYWNVVVRTPNGTESMLPNAFLLPLSSATPPRFTSTAITSATQDQAYSYSLTTTDPDTAGASLVFSSTGLPSGLALTSNGSGGAILSGTPSVSGLFSVSISVSDGSYTTYQNFSLAVFPPSGNAAPVITTSVLPEPYVDFAYSTTVSATDTNGNPLSLSLANAKPGWLTFTDNGDGTASLTGTPPVSAIGSFVLDISAFDGFLTTTRSLSLEVRPRATIGFSRASTYVNEADGTVTLTVTRTAGPHGPITLSYASKNSSATAADYTPVSGTFSWADGDLSSRTIVIPILQDTHAEVIERFTVTLSALTGIGYFGTSIANVYIDDDEISSLVTVAATDANCTELPDDGSFTITRVGLIADAMTVNYSVSGTATNGTDYAQLNGTVIIEGGSTSVMVPIEVSTDTEYEGDESIILTIEPGADYGIDNPSSAEITLVDNDKPSASISSSFVTVGEDTNEVTFTFNRTGNNAVGPLTVNFAFSGTATGGADYDNIPASVVIPTFESQATVTVPIINDTIIEAPETLTISLVANAAYSIVPAPNNAATITLRDDTESPVLVIGTSDNIASEPNKADGSGAFLITRLGSPASQLTVNLSPPTGSATSGSDYSTLPTSVVFPAGESTLNIPLTVLNDSIAEPDETVILGLIGGNGYTIGNTSTATINLYDDEPAQVHAELDDAICIEQATADVGKVVFRRLGLRTHALTVNYSISGSAGNGVDYNTIAETITINANAGFFTQTITPINDSQTEGTETVTLTITSVTGGTAGGTVAPAPQNTATLDIRDDETYDVTVVAQDTGCAEGSTADPGSFRFTRTVTAATALSINYTISGTATNGSDYTTLSGTAIIPADATQVDIPVTPLNDNFTEGPETITISLVSNGSIYDLGTDRVATLLVTDDDAPIITASASDANAAEPENGVTDNGQWTFTASSAPASNLTIHYTLSGGSPGADYAPLPGTLVLPAGQTSVTLNLTPFNDELYESAETIGLTLQPGANYNVASSAVANVVIAASDSPTIRVYASRSSAAENPVTNGMFRFDSNKIFTANTNLLYFMSGTATNGTDYTSATGSITMNSGNNTVGLSLVPTDDSLSEGAETATLTLIDNTAYSIASGGRTTTVTITDDEADGSRNLLLTPVVLTVAENATSTFTVALDTPPLGDVAVTVSHASGDTDLTVQSGTSLTFTTANWATPQSVTIAAAVDSDALAGIAAFSVAATGHPTLTIHATEADSEALPVITLVSPVISPLAVPDLGVRLEIIAEATDTIGTPTIAWSQLSGPGSAVFANPATGSTSVSFPTAGTYVLRATATDHQSQNAFIDLTVFAGSAGAAFTPTTLGATHYAGSTTVGNGSVTITGTGGDISGTAESGYYVTTPVSGNFSITTRVASLTAAETGFTLNSAAKAGIVVREALTAGSRLACETMRADNASVYLYRTTPSATLSSNATTALSLPYFIRLDRVGNSLTAYRSTNGTNWTQQGAIQSITMTNPVQVGFVVASGNINGAQPRAVFDRITGLPAANGAPQINPGSAPTTLASVAALLSGSVTDDALPVGNALSSVWSVRSAPAGGNVVFVNANNPTTQATFSTSGNYVLRLSATDGTATVFEELTVNVTSSDTFSTWISTQPGVGEITSPTGDADFDGVPNLLEYALGSAPGNSQSTPLVSSSLTSTAPRSLTLTFTPARIAGLTYHIESSPDLVTWTATNITSLLTAGQPYVYTAPTQIGNSNFLRLKVSAP